MQPVQKISRNAQCRLSGTWTGWERLVILGVCLLACPQAAHSFAIGALGTIDLKGNNIASDSFDSSDPLYSTNGLYTASKRKAGGDIITSSGITNSTLNVANANIAGHIQIGRGGNWNVGIAGTVGDLAWVDSNTPGVQPGWAITNRTFLFPSVVLPAVPWAVATNVGTGGGGTAPDGKSYNHIFTSPLDTIANPGNYTITDSGGIYVGTNVSVRLNVIVGNFKPNNIWVAGVNASEAGRIVAYLNGPPGMSMTLGTTDKTQSGRACNLVFMGMSNCADITYTGNGDFTGTIYAPQANFHLAGGGSGYIDFIGASVAKTVQIIGHYHFHADEALYRSSYPLPFLFAGSIESQSVAVGQNVSFEAFAIGAEPLSYQWRFQGSDIPGATNSLLTVTNVQITDSGFYQVTITNQTGSVSTSTSLGVYVLDVLVPSVSMTNGSFRFWVSGAFGQNYVIESSTNLVDWSAVGTSAAWSWFTDTNAAAFAQRFYRAVYVP